MQAKQVTRPFHGAPGPPSDSGHRPIGNGYWTNDSGTHALITHNGDYLRGDGLQHMLARMPDGRFYMYPGDGYGSFDVSARLEVLLPADAPDPAALTEIKATGDITGDGLPDLFANGGGQLWAFTGYTGGSFAEAELLCGCSGAWNGRDIVSVADVSGDSIADLVYRTHGSERLYLREGKPATAGGGVDLSSLGTAADSADGSDLHYGSGWSTTAFPLVMGTPDVNGDGVPDIWTLLPDGSVRVYHATPTWGGSPSTVITGGWQDRLTFG